MIQIACLRGWRRLCAGLVLGTALAGTALPCLAQQHLGRLFLTPERRALLERQRQLNVQQARVFEGAQISLGGLVTRSGGRSTVWLNGVPYHDGIPAGDVQTQARRADAGQVVLRAGERLQTDLKVGESVNRSSGERQDALHGGRIDVNRTPAAAKPRR